MDLQLIKSTLFRNQLDNAYLQNNQRTAINAGKVNLDDLLTSRPHGIVRTDGPPSENLMLIPTPQLPDSSFQMLLEIDKIREQRTGVNQYMQALDPKVLQRTTDGAFDQATSMSMSRVEMMARIFAETGFKRSYLKIHELLRKHHTKPMIFKLRGKWIDVNPTEWKDRTDFTVSVGLGHGTKEQNLKNIEHLIMLVSAIRKDPETKPMCGREEIYNLFTKTTELLGFKDVDSYIKHPSQVEQGQAPPDPQVAMEQEKAKAMQEKAKADQMKAQVAMEKIKVEREKLAQEKQDSMREAQQHMTEAQMDQLRRYSYNQSLYHLLSLRLVAF